MRHDTLLETELRTARLRTQRKRLVSIACIIIAILALAAVPGRTMVHYIADLLS